MITSGILAALVFGSVLIGRNIVYEKNTEQWIRYKLNFNKTYNTSQEDALKRQVFLRNLRIINSHNAKSHSTFKVGLNQYSDLTFEEIQKMNEPTDAAAFNLSDLVDLNESYFEDFDVSVPESFDWRDAGVVVTRVRDQKFCGACYAFATLTAVESQLILKYNKSFELSPQELIDCGSTHGMLHCLGGVTNGVFSYINFRNGISLEENYPYKAVEEHCKDSIERVNISIKSFWMLENENEEVIKAALFLHGPIIVLFDCINDLFIKYSSGIYFDSECSNSNDFTHAAVIVGYGSENGIDYWVVKNSWGTTWGENGYFRINFQCQIARIGQIPILN